MIYKDDIKLFESKVMTEADDGGGAMTDQEIISGEHNSIFPDISDLDRAYGVVGIRSVHLKVDADTDETYFGATVGLSETPEDEMVEVTLMSTNDPYIERAETRDLVERYLTKGAKYQGELLYDQLEGQRAIRLIQREEIDNPVAGDVLVLIDKATDNEQYVKVDEVTSVIQSFTQSINTSVTTYYRKVVTVVITESLRYEFTGVEPSPFDPLSDDSAVYATMVADAAKYYGMKQLATDGEFNTNNLKVDSIYTQLVPSTRIETAHINKDAVNLITVPFDRGDGVEVDYITGVESRKIDVTIANQGYLYTATLVPIPTAGTTKVSFMSQGNWYELQDDGTGTLTGLNSAYGTGQLDEFGNLLVTCGALPDVDVPIIVQYQSIANYLQPIAADELVVDDEFTISLGDSAINSELTTITWDDKTATIVDGIVSGDMVGEYVSSTDVSWSNGGNTGDVTYSQHYSLKVKFTTVPDSDTEFTLAWGEQSVPQELQQKVAFSFDRTIQDGDILNLPTNLPAGKLKLSLTYDCSDISATSFNDQSYPHFQSKTVRLLDDGLGNLIAQTGSKPIAGAVNYTTGLVTLNKITIPFTKTNYIVETALSSLGTQYNILRTVSTEEVSLSSADFVIGLAVYCTGYEESSITPAGGVLAGETTATFEHQYPLEISVHTPTEIIEETLTFNYNNRDYSMSGNTIYSLDRQVGYLNLETGDGYFYEWGAGDGVITLLSGVSKTGVVPQTQYSLFRTAGSPVASQSLQVNATGYDGNNINAVTDSDGNITSGTDDFIGTIITKIGVVELVASGLLDTTSMKYNCVSYNYLSLDADQLGLDPIRLPSDGRVVIFEKGDVVVVHQDNKDTVTVAAGNTVQLEVRLATCESTATDAVFDLDAGTVTFPTAGTYDITYRFEDMALLTYVDIAGTLKLSKYLSHNYDSAKSKIASLLIAGDLYARYTNLFDQSSWTGVFSDDLIGSEAAVAYNDTLYPITVTDDGCITEQMAIVFTSSTAFKLIGANIGQIAVGDINTDFAPINPVSGKPYFTLDKLGWGSGWSTNNCLRFDTYGAVYQLNVIRTILQGDSTSDEDSDQFALQIRGNINKELL